MNATKDHRDQRSDDSRSGHLISDAPHSDAIRGRVTAAAGNIGEAASNLSNAASHALPAAKEQVQRASDAVTETTYSIEQAVAACVRDKPLNSLFMAAGVGMLVGLFMFRR